ncbi:unnamed protein product [Cylindrotheca closterium]|uniref:Uncharacterized protein n=1 Tax=Cylindrotheca closterium TaxID=2856 RepID=A0AAD2FQ13_9STRA|nr:unnamed protein product [Cylindrotheca closterium]
MQLPANETAYSNAQNSEEMDLKKHALSSYLDDMTETTAYTSMGSLTDSITTAGASLSMRSRRGSILKSPSCGFEPSPKKNLPSKRRSRISFSTTPNQVFTIENTEEFYEDMFYDPESLADFRYEALMWETGMVDENGTPVSVVESANETNDKYGHLDDLNGSLDFDDLLLDEINPTKTKGAKGPLEDLEQDKEYSRDAIKDLRKSIDGADRQWKSTADVFGNLGGDWDSDDDSDFNDDHDDDIESVAGDDELNDDLDNPFTALDADAPGVSLSSKEKFDKQRRQLSFHKNKQLFGGAFNLEEEDDAFSLEPSEDDCSQRSERSFEGNKEDSQRSQRSPSVSCEVVNDSERTQSTVVGDTSERSQLRKKLVKRDSVRQSLQSLSNVFLSSSSHHGDSSGVLSLDVSAHDNASAAAAANHNNNNNGEGDRRSRLMAKMKGLRESLRSIQDMEDIDSDDDSEWGDEEDEDLNRGGSGMIDTKNLKRSLIVKHMIYSPVPNQGRGTIERMESFKELTVPEL